MPELTPEERRRIYEEEKARIEGRPAPSPPLSASPQPSVSPTTGFQPPATVTPPPKVPFRKSPNFLPITALIIGGICFVGYGIFYTMTPQGQHLQIEQEAQEARERDLQSRQEEIRAQKDSQEQAAQAQRDAEASAYNPEQLGGIGILSDGEPKDKVVVARDEKTVDQLVEAAAAKDSVGWTRILLSGRAFTVSYGTKAKHLSLGSGLTGFDKMHVRIMEGRHEGEDGWIPTEWLTKP